jgi:hypothetical protein
LSGGPYDGGLEWLCHPLLSVCLCGGRRNWQSGRPLLSRFMLVSLLCHWIVGVDGGRGLLHQYPFAVALPAMDTSSVTADTRPGASRVAAPNSAVAALTRENRPRAVAGGKPHCELQGPYQVERSEVGSCKASTRACPKERRHRPPSRPEISAGPALCRADGPRKRVESRRPRGRVVKATTTITPSPISKPSPQAVTEAPEQPKVTANRTTARPEKPQPKSIAGPKPAAGKRKKKAAANVRTTAAKTTTPKLVISTQPSSSPLEDISDLDRLPRQACVELTRRLLTSISSLPTWAARPRAALKTVILFVPEYGSTP